LIEQVPSEAMLHVAGDGTVTLPEPPAWIENVMVSPVTVPWLPISVTPHVDVAPIAIGELHDKEVVVAANGTT